MAINSKISADLKSESKIDEDLKSNSKINADLNAVKFFGKLYLTAGFRQQIDQRHTIYVC
jgi:hypothetical protein